MPSANMILKDISFIDPQKNLFYDDVLLQLAERGLISEVLRFWEAPAPFIVLGRISKEEEDIDLKKAREHRIPVLRRSSGGGTVVQGPGCLNFSLILSKEKDPRLEDLKKSYQVIMERIIEGLGKIGIDAAFEPISDLALKSNRKKFSGNAQRRGRKFILHHGTLLYNFDLRLIERLLKMPKAVPEYRQGRSHLEFVTNISAQADQIKDALSAQFPIEVKEPFLSDLEQRLLKEFLLEKNNQKLG